MWYTEFSEKYTFPRAAITNHTHWWLQTTEVYSVALQEAGSVTQREAWPHPRLQWGGLCSLPRRGLGARRVPWPVAGWRQSPPVPTRLSLCFSVCQPSSLFSSKGNSSGLSHSESRMTSPGNLTFIPSSKPLSPKMATLRIGMYLWEQQYLRFQVCESILLIIWTFVFLTEEKCCRSTVFNSLRPHGL